MSQSYLCIDLKSFYASVECVERGLDPLGTMLAVVDERRGPHTICLAITPAMKALGIRNRCRMYEIPDTLPYIKARPRMHRYMEVSADIYGVYLRYISPDDIHVYSIDECFIDATPYLALYDTTPRALAQTLMQAVLDKTGIYATAGIGSNLFLAKVALDITAKHAPDRIGELDEEGFRRDIWHHRPITDIWNVGPGTARRLEAHGIHDLAGVALTDPQILYREFGVNAEYLIDHAWGQEPCTIAQIHAYRPASRSMSNGQVLCRDYAFEEADVLIREMVDAMALELVEKGLATDHVGLSIGYARTDDSAAFPGRTGPSTNVSRKMPGFTNSYRKLIGAVEDLYRAHAKRDQPVRRINITFSGLAPEALCGMNLLANAEADGREHDLQKAVVAVKSKFGKNALFKGISMSASATGRERNEQIGGHSA